MPQQFTNSLALFNKAKELIPSCTQTFSKGWLQYPFGVSPIFLEKANGCFVWDVDGNEFIEYGMGLRSVTLGHAYPSVVDAAYRQFHIEQEDRGWRPRHRVGRQAGRQERHHRGIQRIRGCLQEAGKLQSGIKIYL